MVVPAMWSWFDAERMLQVFDWAFKKWYSAVWCCGGLGWETSEYYTHFDITSLLEYVLGTCDLVQGFVLET
jgi:hypothetical protein